MNKDCIFCRIIAGEVGSHLLYENDYVQAFLDINPVSLGHVLIIPKKHYENIYDIDDSSLSEIVIAAKKIAKTYRKVFGFNNLQLIHSAGREGQQEVFHFHLHLIPRHQGDGLNIVHLKKKELLDHYDDFIDKFKKIESL